METLSNSCHSVRSFNDTGSSLDRVYNVGQFSHNEEEFDEHPISQKDSNSAEIRHPSLEAIALAVSLESDDANLLEIPDVRVFAAPQSVGNFPGMLPSLQAPSKDPQDSQASQHSHTTFAQFSHQSSRSSGPAAVSMQNIPQIPDAQQSSRNYNMFRTTERNAQFLQVKRGNHSNPSRNNSPCRIDDDRSSEGSVSSNQSFGLHNSPRFFENSLLKGEMYLGLSDDLKYVRCIREIFERLEREDVELLKFLPAPKIIPEGKAEMLMPGEDLCNFLCVKYQAKCVVNLFYELLSLIGRNDLAETLSTVMPTTDQTNITSPLERLRIICYPVMREIDKEMRKQLFQQLRSAPLDIKDDILNSKSSLKLMRHLIFSLWFASKS